MSTRYVWGKYNVKESYSVSSNDDTYAVRLDGSSVIGASNYTISNGKFTPSGSSVTLYLGDQLNANTYPYIIDSSNNKMYGDVYSTGTIYWDYDSHTKELILYMVQADTGNIRDILFNIWTCQTIQKQGSFIDNISSSSSSAYPSNGVSGSYWYKYLGSDNIDPILVSYSSSSPKAGESITISISKRTPTQPGTIYYQYQYSINNGSTWTNIGSKTTATNVSVTIPTNATQFKARVLASDNLGFTSSTYVVGDNLIVQTSSGDNYIGIGGTARQIDKIYIGIGGTAREIVEGYIGIGGTARKFYG